MFYREFNRKGETVLQEKNSFELLHGAVFEKALRELKTKVSLLGVGDESELTPSEKVRMATMYGMIMRVETSSPQHYKECIQHLLSEVMRIIW